MDIEIRLKKILHDAGEDRHGKIQEIADRLDMNRHTVRKIYNNEVKHLPLDTLGKICDYLEAEGLGEGLPGALFGERQSSLMSAIAGPGLVKPYVGEYRGIDDPRFSVSRDDASAEARLIARLSRLQEGPRLEPVHVPSHLPSEHPGVGPSRLEADRQLAEDTFKKMRHDTTSTPILIGSQRANYLTELFVCDLFRCDPYVSSEGRIPIFLKYQDGARTTSAFGGDEPPIENGNAGLYYKNGDGGWECMKSEPRVKGAGCVIIRRDPGLDHLEVALFGVSAIATAAIGKIFCDQTEDFYTSPELENGLEVAIYVCGFDISGMASGEESIDKIQIKTPKIKRLEIKLPGKRSA